VTAFDAEDCGPVPTAFVAATLKINVLPFGSPVTTTVARVAVNVCGENGITPTYGVTT